MDDPSDIEVRAEQRVGRVLNGKWTLESLLGIGGMAAVYAATHRNKKRAAIKILHPELSTDSFIRQRFLREGYIANTVEHPGAVAVNDDDVAEDGSAYLVMDLLEGESLKDHWTAAGERLPSEQVLELAHQLLDTLGAAHEKGILHRDIKPENLFLTHTGELRVLDFGIARLKQDDGGKPTQTGDVIGTPSYMSPEQARGRWEEVDHRSDLWAAGAVMYALLTGDVVHDAETVTEALVKAVTESAPSVASRAPDTPPAVAAVVDKALSFDKEARYADAAAMRSHVESVYQELTGKTLRSKWVPQQPRDNDDQALGLAPTVSGARRDAAAPALSSPTAGGVSSAVPKKETSYMAWAALAAVLLVGGVGVALWAGGGSVEPEGVLGAADSAAEPSAAEAVSAPTAADADEGQDRDEPAGRTAASASAATATASVSASAVRLPPRRPPVAGPARAPDPSADPMDRRR